MTYNNYNTFLEKRESKMKKIRLFPLLILACLALTAFAPAASALEAPQLTAKAVVLADLASGRVLYSSNMDEQRAPASLTKIMTSLLVIEAVERGEHSMDETVTAGDDCLTGLDEQSSNAGIVAGEQMSLQNFLYCALISSANEACNVLASYIAGSIDGFVELMNRRAAELGCANTQFADPNGLSGENRTTAYDLYLITSEAIKHPDFMTICNATSYTVPATNVNKERIINNSNALISASSVYGAGYVYQYAAGVKTGYTSAAGYCLISTAAKDGVSLLAVVLGCDGWLNAGIEEYKNFEDTIALYNWAFDNYSYKTVLTADDPIQKVSVQLAQDDGTVILRPQSDVTLLLPSDLDSSSVTTTATVYEDRLVAPIKAGTVLGEATFSIDGVEYGKVSLVNNADVELSRGEYFKLKLKAIFSNGLVMMAIVVVLLLVVGYIALVARYRRMRKEQLRRQRLAEQRRRKAQEQERADAAGRAPPQDAAPGASGQGEDFDWENMWK